MRRLALAFATALLLAHPLEAACTNPTLQQLTSVDTGGFNQNLSVGDVNRDGWVDFVVGSADTDDVRVFFGNGDGTFDPHVPYAVTDAGLVLVKDVNNDTWPDIIVNHGDTSLGVLLNDGDGTFADVASITTTLHLVTSIDAADFNGDGYQDLLITDLANTAADPNVHVFWNNGSGAFPTRIEWQVSGTAADAVPGDFNGDGMRDVAVVYGAYTGTDPGTLAIFLNANNGNFPITANFSYTLPTPGTNNSYDLDVADFNGNNRLDLIVSKYDGFKLYLGNADGSFSSGMSGTMSPSDFVAVAANDFNEDGKTDAVFASRNGEDIVFINGQGNGNFTMPPYRYATAFSHMSDVATTDLDNDGRPDFLLTEYDATEVRVYRNVCNSRFATTTIEAPTQSTYPQNVEVIVRVTPRGGFLTPTGNVTLTDNGNFVATKPLTPGAVPTATATFTLTKPAVGSHTLVATYAGDGNFGGGSASSDLTIVRPPFGPPLDLVATGNIAFSRIDLTWVGRTGAVSYDVMRMNNGTWEVVGNTISESFSDFALENTKPYVYAIRARSAAEELSALSNADTANTFTYTSNPLSLGATVKAIDVTQLRSMVNGLRAAVGLTAATFTDPTLTAGTVIKRVHITELRTALQAALAVVAIPAPAYSQPTLIVIRRNDQQEIRNAMN